MSLAPGSRLGVFQLQERIGAGGMGEVYRARDTRLGHDVAIKILPAALAARSRHLDTPCQWETSLSRASRLDIGSLDSPDRCPGVVVCGADGPVQGASCNRRGNSWC